MQHVSFQMAIQRKFLHALGTNIISNDAGANGNAIIVVRAYQTSFPASVTPIPGRILVDVSHVFGQTTLACVRTGTAWAGEALANVFGPGVIGHRRRAPYRDQRASRARLPNT